MHYKYLSVVSFVLIQFLFSSLYADPLSQKVSSEDIARSPKNIVLMIGDGMGPAHIKAFRLFNDKPNTEEVDRLLLDSILMGTLDTDPFGHQPAQSHYLVTDSAASATAYSAGIKTRNGFVGLDQNKKNVATVLELAKSSGRRTGLVATSKITHATPGSFIAHVDSREEYHKIADAFIDNQQAGVPVIDVFYGGGMEDFSRNDRNLITELKAHGFNLITDVSAINTRAEKIAGIFADKSIPSVKSRMAQHPSLAQMTSAALANLDNQKGFFLLVEGSQIDWASHDNDIARTLDEMHDFNQAVETALEYAVQDGQTLVIITSDHETGGLSVGAEYYGKHDYEFNTAIFKRMDKTVKVYAEQLVLGAKLENVLKQWQVSLLPEERKTWAKIKPQKDTDEYTDFLSAIVNRVTNTGWTTKGHTGVDVYVYAKGVGAESFRGHHHNTYVGKMIKQWLQVPR